MSRFALTLAGPFRTGYRKNGFWRLIIFAVIVLILCCYASPIKTYISRSQQIKSEKENTEVLRAENERLLKEKEYLQKDEYIEQVARRDLGLVKPGEQSYVVKDLNGSSGAPEPEPVVEQAVDGQNAVEVVIDKIGSLLP